MSIAEAIRNAMEKHCMIRRQSWSEFFGSIKPTNDYSCCCVACSRSEKPPRKYWNPLADDLLAEDWELTEY